MTWTTRSSSETGLWAIAKSSAIARISRMKSVIERRPFGFLASLAFNETTQPREVAAQLEARRFQASAAVGAEEIIGCKMSEQIPSKALRIIRS